MKKMLGVLLLIASQSVQANCLVPASKKPEQCEEKKPALAPVVKVYPQAPIIREVEKKTPVVIPDTQGRPLSLTIEQKVVMPQASTDNRQNMIALKLMYRQYKQAEAERQKLQRELDRMKNQDDELTALRRDNARLVAENEELRNEVEKWKKRRSEKNIVNKDVSKEVITKEVIVQPATQTIVVQPSTTSASARFGLGLAVGIGPDKIADVSSELDNFYKVKQEYGPVYGLRLGFGYKWFEAGINALQNNTFTVDSTWWLVK